MTRRRVSSVLCCETAKRRIGPRGVRLGRSGASGLVSRIWSDWQAISFSPRSIDHSISSFAHSYAYRNCYDDALRPELFHVHWETTGNLSTSTTSSRPFWTKGGLLGRAFVRSIDQHLRTPLS